MPFCVLWKSEVAMAQLKDKEKGKENKKYRHFERSIISRTP